MSEKLAKETPSRLPSQKYLAAMTLTTMAVRPPGEFPVRKSDDPVRARRKFWEPPIAIRIK
jgi:hypothetical protein